jgi:hypothetical protein
MKSHRTTQVDMIITSMREPSLHPAQAGAEGIYARALSTASTLSEGSGGVAPRSWRSLSGGPAGKIGRSKSALVFAARQSRFQPPRAIGAGQFLVPSEFFGGDLTDA